MDVFPELEIVAYAVSYHHKDPKNIYSRVQLIMLHHIAFRRPIYTADKQRRA